MLIGDELVRGAYLIDWRWRTARQRSAGGVTIIYTGIRTAASGEPRRVPSSELPADCGCPARGGRDGPIYK